jgi:hypothetical protein
MENNMIKMAKVAAIFVSAFLIGQSLNAQQQERNSYPRLLVDLTGSAVIPLQEPMAVGGGPAVGLAFRDFNALFKPSVFISDLSGGQKIVILPAVRLEAKISLLPNFLTLLPYLDAGAMALKLRRPDTSLGQYTFGPYVELGVGAEITLTHEISLIPRIGFAYAMVTETDTLSSSNQSGPTVSLSLRYNFGRSQALAY